MAEHIIWDDDGQPLSPQFNDVYFSKNNGLAETDYVFLQHNQLDDRFQALIESSPQSHASNKHFTIAETGFGTGLNFLATYQLWNKYFNQSTNLANTDNRHIQTNQAHLHFISVEKYPLSLQQLEQALNLWPELKIERDNLLEQYPSPLPGFHRIVLPHNVTLTLIIDDAVSGFQELLASHNPQYAFPQWQGVDAWFLDGFTPSRNPDMWTPELFSVLAQLSHPTTTLATFTAASHVRRGLIAAGFTMLKDKGYGKKREMMFGVLTSDSEETLSIKKEVSSANAHAQKKKHHITDNAPWMVIGQHQATPINEAIAVIGGGIAGCHTAYALAQKGYQVTIFEQGETLASGASGNVQGVVYAKLSATIETQGEFNRYCLEYAQPFYKHYWENTNVSAGEACGVLHLAFNEKTQKNYQQIAERLNQYGENVHYLSQEAASRQANTQVTAPGLFYPESGWINLHALCQWLCEHPNITVKTHTCIEALEDKGSFWQLNTLVSDGQITEKTFHTVIIANAYDAKRLDQTRDIPLKNIRGQVTHYPANKDKDSDTLSIAVCGKGYIAPATQEHCIGATFNLHSTDTSLDLADHVTNIQNMVVQTPDLLSPSLSPPLSIPDTTTAGSTSSSSKEERDVELLKQAPYLKTLEGRVGFRCVSPDYLPIVGAVPVTTKINEEFKDLQRDARLPIHSLGTYHPRLYMNIGHGSRGLAYTPLCSEWLASLIAGHPPSIPQSLSQKLNPARFIIRDIIRS